MHEELIEKLRCCVDQIRCGDCRYVKDCDGDRMLMSQAADAIKELSNAGSIYGKAWTLGYDAGRDENKARWTPVTEGMPKCEQEVLISTEKKLVGRDAYIDSIVTPAIYEDGTMRENDSIWRWEDIDWAGWDEEEDCGIIPEGWWENRHFNPDNVYNNPVDRKVVAWMPMPESYKPPKEE